MQPHRAFDEFGADPRRDTALQELAAQFLERSVGALEGRAGASASQRTLGGDFGAAPPQQAMPQEPVDGVAGAVDGGSNLGQRGHPREGIHEAARLCGVS